MKNPRAFACVCARQRTIWSLCRAHTHGKGSATGWPGYACQSPLPCDWTSGARQRCVLCRAWRREGARQILVLCRAVLEAHGNVAPHGSEYQRTAKDYARQRAAPHGKGKAARQRRCRAFWARRTAKSPLPGRTSPCGLCRPPTHGKALPCVLRPLPSRIVARQCQLFP